VGYVPLRLFHYKKFYRRQMYLEELATRSGDSDEFIIDSYEGGFYSSHAHYTLGWTSASTSRG
jgi:hypothetical protein